LQGIDHTTEPVLEEVRDIADGVTVREKVPATGAVTVVVEPGTKDEVGSDAEEGTEQID
jgi:hypothetical protein